MWQFNFADFVGVFTITKCDKAILLQNVTSCYYKLGQILQNVRDYYHKVGQVLHSVTVCYYKVHQVLQSVKVITEWDVTALPYVEC